MVDEVAAIVTIAVVLSRQGTQEQVFTDVPRALAALASTAGLASWTAPRDTRPDPRQRSANGWTRRPDQSRPRHYAPSVALVLPMHRVLAEQRHSHHGGVNAHDRRGPRDSVT
jgi:hypothetical protein